MAEACERADADDSVRALLLTGTGEDAFVAGTDIGQFAGSTEGADGVACEQRIGALVERLSGGPRSRPCAATG